jgi:pyruvate,water dikinase
MNAADPVPLSNAHDPSLFGGKAAALSQLNAAGLPVADGLVLPTSMSNAHVSDAIGSILTWAAGRAPYGLITRSSATVEDGTDSSFAGVFASRFTPAEPGALLDALHQVRSSATSPASSAYATARGTPGAPAMAVLIQPALRPHSAGVLAAEFAGDNDLRWQIEAVHGLAEPLVSGRQTGELHSSDLNDDQPVAPIDQPVIVLPAGTGELRLPPGEWINLPAPGAAPVPAKLQTSHDGLLHVYRPDEWATDPVITRSQRSRLLRLAQAAAKALRLDHIDIEWALTHDGDFYLLQARPMTAPFPDIHDKHPTTRPTTWEGIPGAPGIGAGPILFLTDDTAQTQPPAAATGSVIICEHLGPETVHVLLARPAAIASTTGGPLSHAAIVSRELGIPCVTAIPTSITAVPAGTYASVDGTTGTLSLTTTPPAHPGSEHPTLRGAAVLTDHVPTEIPDDGRTATLILHDPDTTGTHATLDELTTPAAGGSMTPIVGILQPTNRSGYTIRAGYHERLLPSVGRLLWPNGRGDPPRRIVVLAPDGQVLHHRTQ